MYNDQDLGLCTGQMSWNLRWMLGLLGLGTQLEHLNEIPAHWLCAQCKPWTLHLGSKCIK